MNGRPSKKFGRVYALGLMVLFFADPVVADRGVTAEDIWVTVEGTAPFGEETSLAEAKAHSRDDARRRAVEQAMGTFVSGKTVVFNYQLVEDLVQTIVRGIIVSEQILEEGVNQINVAPGGPIFVHRTKLTARVKQLHPELRNELNITASLNKTVFAEGEEATLNVIVSQDSFLHVFNIGQDGEVTVLMPNRFSQHNFVQAGKPLTFPSDQDLNTGLHLRTFLLPGSKKSIEKLKIIVTTRRIDLIRGKVQEGLYQAYPSKGTALITDVIKTLTLLDESEWAERTLAFEVRK